MCFDQRGDIFTLNGSSLKLVDKFTYLGSSVSSTETDINTWLAKVWAAIDRLSVIWKLDLTDKTAFNAVFSKRGPHNMDEQKQDEQLQPIYNSCVPIEDVTLKTSRKLWTIEMSSERGSVTWLLSLFTYDYYYYYLLIIYLCWQCDMIIIIIYSFRVFHLNVIDSKCPQVSRTILSILDVL